MDISSALVMDHSKSEISVDADKILDLISAHELTFMTTICVHEFYYSGHLLSCRKCGKVFP